MSTILIGIAGGTGSGKTTLTRHLKEHFGPEVSVISHDSYYKGEDIIQINHLLPITSVKRVIEKV